MLSNFKFLHHSYGSLITSFSISRTLITIHKQITLGTGGIPPIGRFISFVKRQLRRRLAIRLLPTDHKRGNKLIPWYIVGAE